MTITLLDLQHVAQMKGNPDSASGHTAISIEYAISVLEEMLKVEKRDNRYLHDLAKDKIKELKSIL
jgi:hypothetical protein